MAKADYYLCDICEGKAFYDAELHYEDDFNQRTGEYQLGDVGDMKVICRKCAEKYKVVIEKVSKPKPPPANWEQCFERIWEQKGKKGSKKVAKEKFLKMSRGETESDTEGFTNHVIKHMMACRDDLGFREMHLTTYLNQERWQE